MKTFHEFISDAAMELGGVNLLFEQGMYQLMDDLSRIVTVLRDAKISFEVIGGIAVNAHVAFVGRSIGTRDIDILIQRQDLEKVVSSAESAGYSGRKTFGGFMLIRPGQKPEDAVHLLFSGERPRSANPLPNPSLHPEEIHLFNFDITIPVARLQELVQMKLNVFRPKDEVHLELLDKCGLISEAIESSLPTILKERLVQARSRFSIDDFEEVEDDPYPT